MKNQLQTAITQRDRAVQVALNFVGHQISSSDGSYDLLKECIYDAIREAYAEGAAEQIAITAKAERQECLKILQKAYQEWFDGDHSPGEAFESAKERIQARNDNSP